MFEAGNRFLPQASLAVAVLRTLRDEPTLALKGGTAINLFYRDLPRLSVDLDLVYLPLEERELSLQRIAEALHRSAERIGRVIGGARVHTGEAGQGKLTVQRGLYGVKVEVNLVLRGSVFPAVERAATAAVQDAFGDVTARVLPFEDVYAGKIVAALDRQHPRDLYDVMLLLEDGVFSESLLDAFVVYLAGHDRPMSEVIAPREKDIAGLFAREFADMAAKPVGLDALLEARSRLVRTLHASLLPRHRDFLRSLKALAPDWALLPVAHAAALPSLRWRLLNLEKFRHEQPNRYAEARDRLNRVLDGMS
jgi:hypothetical protein